MWFIHSKLICRVTVISFICREMFFLLLEHSELTLCLGHAERVLMQLSLFVGMVFLTVCWIVG